MLCLLSNYINANKSNCRNKLCHKNHDLFKKYMFIPLYIIENINKIKHMN